MHVYYVTAVHAFIPTYKLYVQNALASSCFYSSSKAIQIQLEVGLNTILHLGSVHLQHLFHQRVLNSTLIKVSVLPLYSTF